MWLFQNPLFDLLTTKSTLTVFFPHTEEGCSENAECGVRSAECGVRSAECGVRSAECGVRSAECGVRCLKKKKEKKN